MFNLFRTKDNPKGPNLSKLQELSFDLAESKLSFSLPYGNHRSINDDCCNEHKIKIHDHKTFEYDNQEDSFSYKTILQRHYHYSCFNWPGFAGLNLIVNLYRVSQAENLFDETQLQKAVLQQTFEEVNAFNKKADKNNQTSLHNHAKFSCMGNTRALEHHIVKNSENGTRPHYSFAVSPHHYVSFLFRYQTVRDKDETWYKMAQALEKQILSSLKLELDDSLLKLKETSSAS